MPFEEGKAKLAKLNKLLDLKNDLKSIKRPDFKGRDKTEVADAFYRFMLSISKALSNVISGNTNKGNGLVDLLTELGCNKSLSSTDADNLKFWAGLNRDTIGKKMSAYDGEVNWTVEEMIRQPQQVFVNRGLTLPKDWPDVPASYLAIMLSRMVDTVEKTTTKTTNLLDDFLKTQKKPRTSILSYVKSRDLDK